MTDNWIFTMGQFGEYKEKEFSVLFLNTHLAVARDLCAGFWVTSWALCARSLCVYNPNASSRGAGKSALLLSPGLGAGARAQWLRHLCYAGTSVLALVAPIPTGLTQPHSPDSRHSAHRTGKRPTSYERSLFFFFNARSVLWYRDDLKFWILKIFVTETIAHP